MPDVATAQTTLFGDGNSPVAVVPSHFMMLAGWPTDCSPPMKPPPMYSASADAASVYTMPLSMPLTASECQAAPSQRAMPSAHWSPPASSKLPPAYSSPFQKVIARQDPHSPSPNGSQPLPVQRAMLSQAGLPPASRNWPAT